MTLHADRLETMTTVNIWSFEFELLPLLQLLLSQEFNFPFAHYIWASDQIRPAIYLTPKSNLLKSLILLLCE